MRIEKSIYLARISKSNGKASERERRTALEEARAAQVTHLDYLRALLLLEIVEDNVNSAQDWLQSECDQTDTNPQFLT